MKWTIAQLNAARAKKRAERKPGEAIYRDVRRLMGQDLAKKCVALARRLNLTETELGALIGARAETALQIMAGREGFYWKTVDGMRRLIERCGQAKSRNELRLPEGP
jgi:hypothetical protein